MPSRRPKPRQSRPDDHPRAQRKAADGTREAAVKPDGATKKRAAERQPSRPAPAQQPLARRQARAQATTRRSPAVNPPASRRPQADAERQRSDRRRSDDQRSTRRTQPIARAAGRSMLVPGLIVAAILVLIGIGAAFLGTGETIAPKTPEEIAFDDFKQEASLVMQAITGRQYQEAETRTEALARHLDDPLLHDKRATIEARITVLRLTSERQQLNDAVANRALELGRRLRELISEPDLDGLEAEIAAFLADPVGTVGATMVEGYDPAPELARFADAAQRFAAERQRRREGLVTPRFPAATTDQENLADRRARRDYINAEKLVADYLTEQHFHLAFKHLGRKQEAYPGYSFEPLWKRTVTALEQAWPDIRRRCRQLVAKATAASDEDALASARRRLRDLIPKLGDERYMAELRSMLGKLY